MIDQTFAQRAMQYFGVEVVDVEQDPSVHDIQIVLGPDVPLIQLGRGYVASNPLERRQKIVHELIHAHGAPHCRSMRERGYYSNPDRDEYSRRVLADIEAGTPEYDPGRFA